MAFTDDGRFEASAEVLVDGGKMQMLGITARCDRLYTRFVLDYMGRVVAMASADVAGEADALARGELKRKGISVVHEEKLLADAVTGPKRTSVLRIGDDVSLRVKRMDDSEDGSWLQLRMWMSTSAGYVHLVLTDTGHLVCVVSGRTDQDAWQRVQGELNRQGVEFV
jgi:hypothetical protein